MRESEVIEELRLMRKSITELQKEFYLFKGKTLGLLSVMSVLASVLVSIVRAKL